VKLIKLPSLDLYAEMDHVSAFRPSILLSLTDSIEYFSTLTGGFPEPYTFGRRLVRHFKINKPHYDIIHDNQSLCYGVLKLQQLGYPVLTTIHHPITSDLEIALSQTKTWSMRLLIKRWHSFLRMQKQVVPRLRHIVTVSRAAQQDIAEAFNIDQESIDVVHNGIDTELFKPLHNIIRKPFTIMTTASADAPLKGINYLLEAIAIVKSTHPEIELCLIGNLKQDGDSAKLIKSLNIENRINIHSQVTTDKMVQLYAQACMVVVPSIYEGFGLPAAEAMACGLPVISTNGGALPEVIGDCGIIVPTRNKEAIAAAIVDLLDSPEKRASLGQRARQRIQQKFSWARAAEAMARLYSHIPGAHDVP
jgi:glycosyltransferase involved in cell wall biosynthesis